MESGRVRRQHLPPWSFLVVGVVVATAVFASVGPPALLLQHVTVCQLGAEIGTYNIFTPFILVNIPDGGNVTYAANEGNITDSSGALTFNALEPPRGPIYTGEGGGSGLNRAGIFAEYFDRNWTFYRTTNTSVIAASSSPCTQPFVAQIGWPGEGCGGQAIIPIPDNTTDALQPHSWNGTAGFNGSEGYPGCPTQSPRTYATFDSELHLGMAGFSAPAKWDLCGFSGDHILTLNGLAQVPLTLNAPFDGSLISVKATLEWIDSPNLPAFSGPTAEYLVPAGWNWTMAPVGSVSSAINPSLPLPGLVAFERSAC